MRSPKLEICTACGGFVPATASACPHCQRARAPFLSLSRMRLRALGGALGGGAIAFTLMACYGMAPCGDGTDDCRAVDGGDADGGEGGDASRDTNAPDVGIGKDSGIDADAAIDASDDAPDGD